MVNKLQYFTVLSTFVVFPSSVIVKFTAIQTHFYFHQLLLLAVIKTTKKVKQLINTIIGKLFSTFFVITQKRDISSRVKCADDSTFLVQL